FFFQAADGIRDRNVTGVQTCALPISAAPLDTKFNEDHIAATTQAIVEYRTAQGISGPLFIGRDTHALSHPAFDTALEVLAGNDRSEERRVGAECRSRGGR